MRRKTEKWDSAEFTVKFRLVEFYLEYDRHCIIRYRVAEIQQKNLARCLAGQVLVELARFELASR